MYTKILFCVITGIVLSISTSYADTFVGKDNCHYFDKNYVRKVPTDEVVIVLDQSEALSSSHSEQVIQIVDEYIVNNEMVPVGGRVSFYRFGKDDFKSNGDGQTIKPEISLCKPASEGNALYQNNRKINKKFQNTFFEPIKNVISNSVGVAYGERSPILEMLKYLTSLPAFSDDKVKSRKIILISDLLQHSESVSSYKKKFKVPEYLISNMAGWDLNVLQLQRYGRDRSLQSESDNGLWKSYFNNSSVKTLNIQLLP